MTMYDYDASLFREGALRFLVVALPLLQQELTPSALASKQRGRPRADWPPTKHRPGADRNPDRLVFGPDHLRRTGMAWAEWKCLVHKREQKPERRQ